MIIYWLFYEYSCMEIRCHSHRVTFRFLAKGTAYWNSSIFLLFYVRLSNFIYIYEVKTLVLCGYELPRLAHIVNISH